MATGRHISFSIDKYLKAYHKAEVVFRQNTLGREMYIVYSGKVDLVVQGGQSETKLATVGPGEFFGEMALIDDSPRSASALAAEDDTRIIVLDKAKLVELISQQPEIGVIMMETLCRRLRNTNEALARLKKEDRGS